MEESLVTFGFASGSTDSLAIVQHFGPENREPSEAHARIARNIHLLIQTQLAGEAGVALLIGRRRISRILQRLVRERNPWRQMEMNRICRKALGLPTDQLDASLQ